MVAIKQYGWGALALVVSFAVAGVSVLLEPVRETLWFGQVNVILGVLVAADCLLPRTKWPRGLLIGLAAAIKLTGGLCAVLPAPSPVASGTHRCGVVHGFRTTGIRSRPP